MMLPVSDAEKTAFKKSIQQSCISITTSRIETAGNAMHEAQDAANSEEKSSAGDKYETSRAMGHLSRDMNAKQLEEAKRDLAYILALPAGKLFKTAAPGSVVVAGDAVFFISLGLGTVTVNGQKVVLLSSRAPVALLIEGKKAGDTFSFNGDSTKILDVF
jgi:hypothetical protein